MGNSVGGSEYRSAPPKPASDPDEALGRSGSSITTAKEATMRKLLAIAALLACTTAAHARVYNCAKRM